MPHPNRSTAHRTRTLRLLPAVVVDHPDDAAPLARAVVAGGLPVAEVTFRTAAAERAIQRIAAEGPDLLLGAGTVLTGAHVKAAKAAGAAFLVTPSLNPTTVQAARDEGLPTRLHG